MHWVFSVSEKSGLQACKLSTWSLLQWSHAVVVRAESGLASCSWNKHNRRWKICQNTITDVCFWTIQYNNHSLSSLPCIVLCPWLKKKYKNSNFNWPNHRTVFYFASFHHKWAWAQRRRQHFWILFIYFFFFAWYNFNLHLWILPQTIFTGKAFQKFIVSVFNAEFFLPRACRSRPFTTGFWPGHIL